MMGFEAKHLTYDRFCQKDFEVNQHYLVSKPLLPDVNFDFFLCARKEAKRTIILFPSAQGVDVKKQFFHRWSWAEIFTDYNVISISDPALYLAGLSGTWFQSSDGSFLPEIAEILAEVLSTLRADKQNTLLYGSSQGGFGALMCGSMLPGSMVVAEVPQINLEKYPHKSHMLKIIDKIYDGDKDTFYSQSNRENIDVLACINKNKFIPRFLLITNPSDEGFSGHSQFVQNISAIDTIEVPKDYLLVVNNEVVGHKPLPTSIAVQYVNKAFDFFSGGKVYIDRATQPQVLAEYRSILDQAIEVAKTIEYVRDEEDTRRYKNALRLLESAATADTTADWPYLKICQIEKAWSNCFNEKIFSSAKSALARKDTLEGFIYFCHGALYNCSLEEASIFISSIIEEIDSNEITSIGYIFLAIIEYEKGDYEGYEYLIQRYRETKGGSETYITIPVSTVYLPKDKQVEPRNNLESINLTNQLLEKFDTKYIVSISCDSGYFYQYAEYFVRSFYMKCSNDAMLVINILGGKDLEIIAKVNEWASSSVTLNFVDIATGENKEPTASLIRYLCVNELLRKFDVPVLTLDVDCVIKKNFSAMIDEFEGSDLCSRILGGHPAPWEKYTGGFTIFYPTVNSKKVSQAIIDSAIHVWTDKKKQWWIDQNCIEAGIRAVNRLDGSTLKVTNVFQFRDVYCDMPVGPANAKLKFLEKSFKSLLNLTN